MTPAAMGGRSGGSLMRERASSARNDWSVGSSSASKAVGSAWGRHKMAPLVSPNKSWEGAIAGFLTGIVATVLWSWWRLGEVRAPLLLVAAATGIAAQLGDLFESLLKRGVNVKDSGSLIPGHGGFFDRMDAMLFAGPVMLAGLWLIAHDGVGR